MKKRHIIGTAAALVLLAGTVSMAVLAASWEAEADGEVGEGRAVEQSVSATRSAEDAEALLDLYGAFGMTVDKHTEQLQYAGRDIVFFLDADTDGTLVNTFTLSEADRADGVSVAAERDEAGVLTGLRELAEEELDELEVSVAVADAFAGDASDGTWTETAFDSDFAPDEALGAEYAAFGVTVDRDGLVYRNGELAGFFWDEGHYHYAASGHGPLLLAERNAAGEITGIGEITAKEAASISGLSLPD